MFSMPRFAVRPHLIAAASLFLIGCLPGFPSRPKVSAQPAFDPVAFFTGHTHGEGAFDLRVGARRTLTVEGFGHPNAEGAFQLDQTVTFGDSSVEKRRWVLRKRDAKGYTATLSDASGEVRAETTGNLFHLRYQIRQPRVFMEQWLYLQPDGRTVLNQAQVTVLGIPWARLSEKITRVTP